MGADAFPIDEITCRGKASSSSRAENYLAPRAKFAARRLKSSVWNDASTLIKTLTANAQTDDREAVILAGLDGLLIKPLDRERLREALSTASARAFDPLAA